MSSYYSARSEKDVGITLYLGNHSRFTGVVKQRFSDFQVNEIDPSGTIVHLTSLNPPVDNEVKVALNDPEIAILVPENVRNSIASLQESLNEASSSRKTKKEPIEIKVTELDKESRTKIHKWISRFDKLSSETVDKGTDKLIAVVPLSGNRRMNRRPANRARYTHCVMYKEGVETSDAVGFIARKLNLKPGLISYAGIKDKRAKTVQRISVSNIEASRLIEICKYSKGIKLGNFEYQPGPIALGDLKGNHFKLVLKEVKAESDDVIAKAVDSFKTLGFINYFGMQRFGSYEVSTYDVGKKILQNNWLEAFDLILKIKPNDQNFMIKAKKLWLEDRNAEKAIEEFSLNHRSIESHLLHGLARFYHRNDFLNSFVKIPRHVRLLYIHAYQSFLFNRVASYRIQEYGMNPVVGDLVYVNSGVAEEYAVDGLNIDEIGEVEEEPVITANNTQYREKLEVKILNENDIKSAKYTIYDVLIPIHGTEIKQCGNKTTDYVKKLLKEDGIEEDCFLHYKPVTDVPKGAYRKLVVLPKNVSYKIQNYADSDPVDSLNPSDWDLLQDSLKLSQSATEDGTDQSSEVVSSKSNDTNSETHIKDKKCVILEFSLPSSCYATVALRELLEEETSHISTNLQNIEKQTEKFKDDEEEIVPPDSKKQRVE